MFTLGETHLRELLWEKSKNPDDLPNFLPGSRISGACAILSAFALRATLYLASSTRLLGAINLVFLRGLTGHSRFFDRAEGWQKYFYEHLSTREIPTKSSALPTFCEFSAILGVRNGAPKGCCSEFANDRSILCHGLLAQRCSEGLHITHVHYSGVQSTRRAGYVFVCL